MADTATKTYLYGYDTDSDRGDGWFSIDRQEITDAGLSPDRERVATAFGVRLAERICELLNSDELTLG